VNTGAVIVAAGMSTRMNQFKQLMQIGDVTFAERVVLNFRKAGVRNIVMVTGYRAGELEKVLQKLGLVFLRNEDYATTQMLDSAKIGFRYLQGSCDRIFFCPVDVPFFLEETVRRELEREERIVLPICNNRIGHPICLDASLVPYILSYDGPRGLKGALDSSGEVICYLPVEDEGAVMDADTRDDYQKLVDMHNASLLRADIRLTLAGTDAFFGPGTVLLLRQIDKNKSVREASSRIGMSYSKAWNVLRAAERELGYRIVDRQAGGKWGGTASVTERGKKLIAFYEQLESEISEAAQERFRYLAAGSDLFRT